MDTRKLRVLQAVIDTGSASSAARLLRISQPAISKTLSLIEADLGVTLFDRTGGKLLPTEYAHALKHHVDQTLIGVERIKQTAREFRENSRGKITIAAPSAICATVLPTAIARFRNIHPWVEFVVLTKPTIEVLELVVSHEVDLGVWEPEPTSSSIKVLDSYAGEVVCLMPADHELTDREFITPHDLSTLDIVTFAQSEPTGRRISNAFRNEGVVLNLAAQATLSITVCSMAVSRVGLALVDSFMPISGAFPGVVARPFEPRIDVRVQVITSGTRTASTLTGSFVEILKHERRLRPSWLKQEPV